MAIACLRFLELLGLERPSYFCFKWEFKRRPQPPAAAAEAAAVATAMATAARTRAGYGPEDAGLGGWGELMELDEEDSSD
mmetsp:Transcript_11018/g.22973  ORF Transcript_11018/g.22973 Transcript_11018/m.22973 type:complete len:80 (+) Transcript_11018:86-325(+)